MAVVTTKSTAIGNRDASPTVATGASMSGGMVRESEGFVTATNGDSVGSYYPMASIPSNARVSSIILQCDALGTSAAVNCGVYAPTQSPSSLIALNSAYTGGAAISATFFASAVDVHLALVPTEIVAQSGTNTIAKQEQELWQALGLASDPNCNLDIGLAVSAAIAATGKISLKVKHVM